MTLISAPVSINHVQGCQPTSPSISIRDSLLWVAPGMLVADTSGDVFLSH